MERYPAILIGGPPDSGKSVLTYNLTQKLRARGVQHYVLRAAPDGEGDWTGESEPETVHNILNPQTWTPLFVDRICKDLTLRPLPLIVDVGGRPKPWQETIFDHCTHAILLTPNDDAHVEWLALVERNSLTLLADLRSEWRGENRVTATRPTLEGSITGLEWGQPVGGPTFDALLERVARIFDYDAGELRRSHLALAPTDTAIDLDRLAHTLEVPFAGGRASWEPRHLPQLLDYLPEATPLGLYGRGTNWLYAAVALLAHPAPFYQFDARLGWVTPPELHLGVPPADALLQVQVQPQPDHDHLAFSIPRTHLDYMEAEGLLVPSVPAKQGVVIGGKLPLWLYTALALFYAPRAPWVAVYQPQLGAGDQAAVVSSRVAGLSVGDRVTSPPPKKPAE